MPRKKKNQVAETVRPGYEPLLEGVLSPMALRVLEEYRKHYKIDKAFDAVKLRECERSEMLACAKFREQVSKALQWAEKGAEWTKEAAIARHLEFREFLRERAEEGDNKAYAALANLSKNEMDAHGLMRKDDIGSGVVVNIHMDTGVKQVKGEVIDVEPEKEDG